MYKIGQTVRNLVDIQLEGWASVCTPGYYFTVKEVIGQGTGNVSIVISRDNPEAKATVKPSDIEAAYKEVNGISYSSRTSIEVVRVLEEARRNRTRLFIRYGDRETGKSWLSEHDCEGWISNSMGPTKIPILVYNSRSMGGGGLTDDAIVKISVAGKNGRVLYQHPLYHVGKVEILPINEVVDSDTCLAAVHIDGKLHARFLTMEKAEKWVAKFAS